jgi:hypothetical protein
MRETTNSDESRKRENGVCCERTCLLILHGSCFVPLSTLDERLRRQLGIQIWAEALCNEELLALMRRGVDEPRRLLAVMIQSAQGRGECLSQLDPDILARIMITLFHGFILQQAWDKQLPVEPCIATIQAMFQLLLRRSSSSEESRK